MEDQINTLLGTFKGIAKTTDDEKNLTIYRKDNDAIFLVIYNDSDPLRFEVKIGKELTRLFTDKYESVMRARNLDPKIAVEVICSGQLADQETLDLIRASYQIA